MDNQSNGNERIKEIEIQEEMKKSFVDYAMSVIVSRALPDVRDGLKPVHRRILYAMSELGLGHDKKYRKSARIVGDVLGKYHPHGDSSVYNAMVRMAQTFSMRQKLVDGQGNFGSIDGDGAAAMRYTEARMTKLASELMRDIYKNTVLFTPNFDGEEKEPSVMPARYPNLLVNGSTGIAVGMATTIPPHNLTEVINATVRLIDDEYSTVEDLMEEVKGPDFPTGAKILGHSGFRKAYRTGKGKVIIRSTYDIEEHKNGKFSIVFNQIPYQVNKSKLLEGIADLVRNKKVEGITDLRDESNRLGIRIVIEIRRDVNPLILVNQLFKHTQLQISMSINMIALVNGQPKLLNLKEMLTHYVNHQVDVETKRVVFDLEKAKARAHILEGYRIALDNIDEIISIIRNSYNDAEEKLISVFGLSDIQAKAIIDMRLRRLQGLEREKIENEYNELILEIESLNILLNDKRALLDEIKRSLIEIRDKFDDKRRTEIEHDYNEIELEDLIEEEQVTITLTQFGYIKRVPITTFETQNRGGRGKSGISTKEEDHVIDMYTTSTHDYLLFFTNLGKVYKLKAFQVPEGSRISKGTAIINLLPLEIEEKVTSIIPIKNFNDNFIVMITKYGIIKKTDVAAFENVRKTGIIAINLKEQDNLVSAVLTTGNSDLICITKKGKSIRFNENDVREMGRNTIGVKGISLNKADYVVTLSEVVLEREVLIISENGYGKRTQIDEYRVQSRSGKGIITYNCNQKTGDVVGGLIVSESDQLIIMNSNGVVIRIKVKDIPVTGRVTSGVKLMRVDDTCRVVAFAKVVDDSGEQDNSDLQMDIKNLDKEELNNEE